jgi:Rnl2 family RNA ligase
MMTFKKYPSIENSYRDKFVQYMLDQYPELCDAVYIVTEKIDGSNIQLIFEPSKPVQVASRNRVLTPGEDFFGVWDVLQDVELAALINTLTLFVDKTHQTINLYGELFGPGIQRRIDYGDKRRLLFFDAAINEELIPQGEFVQFMSLHGFPNLMVPIVTVINTLQAALDWSVEDSVTRVNPDGHSVQEKRCMEGVVIKPRDKVYRSHTGSTFYLKKKGEKFGEKEQKVKVPREQKEYREEVIQMYETFFGLINENRIKSVFSKHGEIEEPRQIGDYIKLVMADAKEEFLKDYEDELAPFNKDELKYVFNVGNMIVGLLKEYL